MFCKTLLHQIFILTVVTFFNCHTMEITQNTHGEIIPNAVFFKIHTNKACYAGYFHDLREQYHFVCLGDNQNPSRLLWDINKVRNFYSNRCEMRDSENCSEIDCTVTHKDNSVIITYHNKLWETLAHEDITETDFVLDGKVVSISSKGLIQRINSRLDPNAKPEACHAEIIWENKQRIIQFFSTIPYQCILSMPYDGPAFFTQKEINYFGNFLDLGEFRNPAIEINPWEAILNACLVQ